jgi:ribosomal-protein-alanine N-acetyltransferase
MKKMILNDVALRRLVPADKTILAALADNRKIFDNLRDFFPHPYLEENAREFITRCQKEAPPVTFAVEYKGELTGVVGLVLQSDIYRLSAEIGYWIGEPYWGKGIATRAVKLITEYAFDKLKLVRIYSGVFHTNKASLRVLEKNGFSLEGVFKKSMIKNEKLLDEIRFGLVNPEIADDIT